MNAWQAYGDLTEPSVARDTGSFMIPERSGFAKRFQALFNSVKALQSIPAN